MTRTEILTAFLKKSVCPVLLAAFLYNVFFHLAVQYGEVNYMYLLMETGCCCMVCACYRGTAYTGVAL